MNHLYHYISIGSYNFKQKVAKFTKILNYNRWIILSGRGLSGDFLIVNCSVILY